MSTSVDVKTKPEVGDILVSAWGWEQTNIDFYKVIKTTDKSVWLQPIKQQTVQQTGWLSEKVIPLDEPATDYVWDEFGNRSEVNKGVSRYKIHAYPDTYFVKLTSYSSARLWDKKPEHQTHYH